MILRNVRCVSVGDIVEGRARKFCYFILTEPDKKEHSAIAFDEAMFDLLTACRNNAKVLDLFCTRKEGDMVVTKVLKVSYFSEARKELKIAPSDFDLIEKYIPTETIKKALQSEGITDYADIFSSATKREAWKALKARMLKYAQDKESNNAGNHK